MIFRRYSSSLPFHLSGLDLRLVLKCLTRMKPDNGPLEPKVFPSQPPEDVLARHGYKQELKREIGWFSSFSMSFSIIAVTTGLFATYGAGLQTAGPAFIWTWPIVGVGQLLLALVFAKLARRGFRSPGLASISGPGNSAEIPLAWWAGMAHDHPGRSPAWQPFATLWPAIACPFLVLPPVIGTLLPLQL